MLRRASAAPNWGAVARRLLVFGTQPPKPERTRHMSSLTACHEIPGRRTSGVPADVLAQAVLAGACTLGLVTVVCALYLVKSALGINLLPGPSPLHDLLYHFVR